MTQPTIGVVIPAFQVEPWLGRCLGSIIDQDMPPDEVIVVDDGSTDRTAAIATETSGVTLIRQENKGVAAARNTGARAGTTDWILFLDADDVLLPGAMATFRRAITEWMNAAVIDPAYESEYLNGRVVRPADRPTRVYARRHLVQVIRKNPLVGDSLIKREVVERYPYDESLRSAEDLDLWIRLLLDSHEIVRMGIPTTRRLIGRRGSLSLHTLAMRQSRGTVFRRLWREPSLTKGERAVLAYQIARSSMGIMTAHVLDR